jgi:2-phosphosulfolactate phosphatase
MRVSLHWGPVDAATTTAPVAVVVDVLSFTTTLSVALDSGVEVLPFPWAHEEAAAFAEAHDAVLAAGRSQPGVSLSPATVRAATGLTRLVLPSPNGSAISHQLASRGGVVVAASLRNAAAVGAWVASRSPKAVAVVAAGERWPDGSLRPAVEDLLGAGAVVRALGGSPSPGASAAGAAYDEARGALAQRLHACPSGIELDDRGFGVDVDIAAELDSSTVVPLLEGGVFRDAAR